MGDGREDGAEGLGCCEGEGDGLGFWGSWLGVWWGRGRVDRDAEGGAGGEGILPLWKNLWDAILRNEGTHLVLGFEALFFWSLWKSNLQIKRMERRDAVRFMNFPHPQPHPYIKPVRLDKCITRLATRSRPSTMSRMEECRKRGRPRLRIPLRVSAEDGSGSGVVSTCYNAISGLDSTRSPLLFASSEPILKPSTVVFRRLYFLHRELKGTTHHIIGISFSFEIEAACPTTIGSCSISPSRSCCRSTSSTDSSRLRRLCSIGLERRGGERRGDLDSLCLGTCRLQHRKSMYDRIA